MTKYSKVKVNLEDFVNQNKTKKIDLTPDYCGLWIAQNEFASFHMWEKEEGLGKILENYHGRLVEADVIDIKDNKYQMSFIKRYKNPIADLLRSEIIYSGINNQGFIEGDWKSKNFEGKERKGEFYLADIKEDWTIKELEKILGGLHFQKLGNMIKNEQQQFPYTLII